MDEVDWLRLPRLLCRRSERRSCRANPRPARVILAGDLEAGAGVGTVTVGVSGSFCGGAARGVGCIEGPSGTTSGLGDPAGSIGVELTDWVLTGTSAAGIDLATGFG